MPVPLLVPMSWMKVALPPTRAQSARGSSRESLHADALEDRDALFLLEGLPGRRPALGVDEAVAALQAGLPVPVGSTYFGAVIRCSSCVLVGGAESGAQTLSEFASESCR